MSTQLAERKYAGEILHGEITEKLPQGVNKIPVRKFWVLWLCKMRHYVGCLNVLLFFTVNLRNLTFIPCGAYASLHKKPQSFSLAKMCNFLPGYFIIFYIIYILLLYLL